MRLLWVAWSAWTLLAGLLALARALPPAVSGSSGMVTTRIDLGRDPVPVLALLPGLGPHRAEALVLDRVRHGPARDWRELHRIDGFGPAVVEALRAHAILGADR